VPFAEAQTLGDLMVAIITAKVPMVQDLAPWVPGDLAEVVHTALSRDLAVRYADAGVMKDALAQLVREGRQITPELLAAPSEAVKSTRAPRVSAADHRVVHPSEQPPAMARTAREPESGEPRRRRSFVLPVLLAVGAAGGVGVFVMREAPGNTRPEPVASSNEPAHTAAPSGPLIAPVDIRRFELAVDPRAKVEVDGTPRENANGQVTVEGPLGSAHSVVVTLERGRKDGTVVISEKGLVPDRIDVEAETPAARRPAAAAAKGPTPGPEPAKAGQKPAPPKAAPADAKKSVRLNESTSEFE
jgi:serine/threonine-protein kinase